MQKSKLKKKSYRKSLKCFLVSFSYIPSTADCVTFLESRLKHSFIARSFSFFLLARFDGVTNYRWNKIAINLLRNEVTSLIIHANGIFVFRFLFFFRILFFVLLLLIKRLVLVGEGERRINGRE